MHGGIRDAMLKEIPNAIYIPRRVLGICYVKLVFLRLQVYCTFYIDLCMQQFTKDLYNLHCYSFAPLLCRIFGNLWLRALQMYCQLHSITWCMVANVHQHGTGVGLIPPDDLYSEFSQVFPCRIPTCVLFPLEIFPHRNFCFALCKKGKHGPIVLAHAAMQRPNEQ